MLVKRYAFFLRLLTTFVVCFVIFSFILHTYLYQKHICDNPKIYWSLEEALKTPDTICVLHLHSDSQASLSEDILKLKNLQQLHLHIRHLQEVPSFLTKLPHLTELVIDGYQFGSSRDSIQKMFPHTVVYLDYSHPR